MHAGREAIADVGADSSRSDADHAVHVLPRCCRRDVLRPFPGATTNLRFQLCGGYRETLQRTAEHSPLDVPYYRIEVDSLVANMDESEETGTSDFCFRQLWDRKGSVSIAEMGPRRLKNDAAHCGAALALATLAHATQQPSAATLATTAPLTTFSPTSQHAMRTSMKPIMPPTGPPSPAAGSRPSTSSELARSARRRVRCDREGASSS